MAMTNAERQKKWRENNPEMAAFSKARRRYGVTWKEWCLLRRTKKCQICKRENRGNKRLCIDHDHDTGAVRGVLCHDCNRALGLLLESPRIVRRAWQYVKNGGSR